LAIASKLSTSDKSIAFTREDFSRDVGTSSEAISPMDSMVLVMKTSDLSSTSLFDRASLHKTTFHPGLSATLEITPSPARAPLVSVSLDKIRSTYKLDDAQRIKQGGSYNTIFVYIKVKCQLLSSYLQSCFNCFLLNVSFGNYITTK
jgi:hypothetical protein